MDADPDFLRADMVWRFRGDHRLELSYADIERSRDAVQSGVNDRTLRLDQSSRFARAAYGYSLINTPQRELGLLLGLHWPRLTASVSSEDGQKIQEADAASPLFSAGAYGSVALRHAFTMEARIEAGGLDLGQFDGFVLDARAVLGWKPYRRVSLLAGYSWQITQLDGYSDGFTGEFSQRTRGPLVGLQLNF